MGGGYFLSILTSGTFISLLCIPSLPFPSPHTDSRITKFSQYSRWISKGLQGSNLFWPFLVCLSCERSPPWFSCGLSSTSSTHEVFFSTVFPSRSPGLQFRTSMELLCFSVSQRFRTSWLEVQRLQNCRFIYFSIALIVSGESSPGSCCIRPAAPEIVVQPKCFI